MNCPSCLSPGIGIGYMAAYAICGLFFVLAAVALYWASRNGKLKNLEDSKYTMLED
jgi:hypothetical protein